MQITMRRGDIKWIRFSVRMSDGSPPPIDLNDIQFTVKPGVLNRHFCFKKSVADGQITTLSTGNYQFKIDPKDTKHLAFGLYKFDFQIYCGGALKESFTGDLFLNKEVNYPDADIEEPEESFEFEIPSEQEQVSVIPSTDAPDELTINLETPVTVRTSPDYRDLFNKPSINGVTLNGDKTAAELGITLETIYNLSPLTDEEIDIILAGGVIDA